MAVGHDDDIDLLQRNFQRLQLVFKNPGVGARIGWRAPRVERASKFALRSDGLQEYSAFQKVRQSDESVS